MALIDCGTGMEGDPAARPNGLAGGVDPALQTAEAQLGTPGVVGAVEQVHALMPAVEALGQMVGLRISVAPQDAPAPELPGTDGTGYMPTNGRRYTSRYGVEAQIINANPDRPAATDSDPAPSIPDAKSVEGSPEDESVMGEALEQKMLEKLFKFDLGGHELIDPEDEQGFVSSVEEVSPISPEGDILPCRVYELRVHDQFIAADPEAYKKVTEYVEGLEEQLEIMGFDPRTDRTEASKEEDWNKYTRAWTADPAVKGLAWWRRLVPTARALRFLTHKQEKIVSDSGEELPITPEVQAHFRFVHDAIAVRERSVAVAYLMREYIKTRAAKRLRLVSVGSGTAEPIIEGTNAATEGTDTIVDLTVADMDRKSLAMVQGNAEKNDFPGKVTTVAMNVVAPDAAQKILKAAGAEATSEEDEEGVDGVEDDGLREYFPEDGDVLAALQGAHLPPASALARMEWSLIKEGGIMLSGNMVYPRTQMSFVFGIVDWRLINARTEKNIMDVYRNAGILDDPRADIRMYRVIDDQTGVHLYNIVTAVKRPAASLN